MHAWYVLPAVGHCLQAFCRQPKTHINRDSSTHHLAPCRLPLWVLWPLQTWSRAPWGQKAWYVPTSLLPNG